MMPYQLLWLEYWLKVVILSFITMFIRGGPFGVTLRNYGAYPEKPEEDICRFWNYSIYILAFPMVLGGYRGYFIY